MFGGKENKEANLNLIKDSGAGVCLELFSNSFKGKTNYRSMIPPLFFILPLKKKYLK